MKWVEHIKLRATISKQEVLTQLMELEAGVRETPGLVEAVVYCHATIHNDYAFHLLWDTNRPQLQGSRLGVKLGQVLKGFGLVDHSVWIEKKQDKEV